MYSVIFPSESRLHGRYRRTGNKYYGILIMDEIYWQIVIEIFFKVSFIFLLRILIGEVEDEKDRF